MDPPSASLKNAALGRTRVDRRPATWVKTGCYWHPDPTKPGVIPPGFVIVFTAVVGRGASGFLRALGEGSVHFIFLDAVCRISRLTKILFLGAITHHTGVRRRGLFLDFLGIGLAGHCEVSTRKCA